MRDNPRFPSRLAWAGIAALLAVASWFWTLEKGNAAIATVIGTVGCLAIILPRRERAWALPWRVRGLPRGLDAAPVFATLLSSPGYGLNWFYGQNPYDEIVHLVSGGLCGAVFAGLLLADGRPRGVRPLLLLGLGFGIALGVAWEGFEWAVRIIGDFTDTWTDIVLTAGGCAVGCALWGTGPGGLRQTAAGRWRPPEEDGSAAVGIGTPRGTGEDGTGTPPVAAAPPAGARTAAPNHPASDRPAPVRERP